MNNELPEALIKVLNNLNLLKKPFNICILGSVSDVNKKYIYSKKYIYLNIDIPGFTENVYDYISKSNFLFFPIESPYFLIPAIFVFAIMPILDYAVGTDNSNINPEFQHKYLKVIYINIYK